MLLIKSWIIDPTLVFIKNLSINLYLSIFVYLNFLIKNMGFDINNKIKKRKFMTIFKETSLFILGVLPLIMLYYLLCQTIL
jgi:hypothetical protein